MSERMLELRRAHLLGQTPTPKPSPSAASQASTQSSKPGEQSQEISTTEAQSPRDKILAKVLSEDSTMQRFIHRLQRRNDNHPSNDSASGPTVPTALSRRMLQRQGVGYLDETVAAVVSASADRFLATVLQQGIACRDQRLQGLEMAKDAARHRKRHMQHYEADTDDRKRRKEEAEKNREDRHLNTIAAAESLKKGGKSTEDKKKKRQKIESALQTNGDSKDGSTEDDEESYDSIDEEEEYYQERHITDPREKTGKREEEDDEDDTLKLRDLVRPLEAWRFRLIGKEALEPSLSESEEDEEENEENEEEEEDDDDKQGDENGNEDSILFADMVNDAKANGKQNDAAETTKGKNKNVGSPATQATS